MNKKYFILSIDGGGIRGVATAAVLAEIERYTGKRIGEMFDAVAGTSTGSILAGMISVPNAKPCSEVVKLYEERGKDIFKRGWKRKIFYDFFNISDAKYSIDNLIKVVREQVGATRLSETKMNEVLITSYDIERRETVVWKASKARENKLFDVDLADAVVSSSVPPTYFDPHNFISGNQEYFTVDGGAAGMNNPAMCILAETLKKGYRPEDVFMLSLGTGKHEKPIPYKKAKNWGVVQWLKPVIDVMLDGSAEVSDYQVRQVLPLANYIRFQYDVPAANTEMDNISPENLRTLQELALIAFKPVSGRVYNLLSQAA